MVTKNWKARGTGLAGEGSQRTARRRQWCDRGVRRETRLPLDVSVERAACDPQPGERRDAPCGLGPMAPDVRLPALPAHPPAAPCASPVTSWIPPS